jgi:hypothetical protein
VHRSPSGDCEKPIDSTGKPPCPIGSHRSPSGDCESVIPCTYSTEGCDDLPDCSKTPLPAGCKPQQGPSSTDIVIKYYITNPIIQQQVTQQPDNALIQLDTLQFCNQLGDQACVFTYSNLKTLFVQTTKDNLGNWDLNGEAQIIGPFTINNVRIVWHLYDALGNVIGLTQGFPIPSNLGIGQTTLFNLQEKPIDLTGIPKFFRVSFDFLS